jgi:glycyl-tRNA synthetase beta subunit
LNLATIVKEFVMAEVQVLSQTELNVDQLLQSVARLGNQELEQFADRVQALRANRRAPSLPKREAELLQLINRGLSPEKWQRYNDLNDALSAENITDDEHQELLGLIEQVKQFDVERLRNLIELAQLRRLDLDELIKQLGLRPTYA